MRANKAAAVGFVIATAVAVGNPVSAHRRDELLQAARIAVEPDRVDLELDLTPGIAVAGAVIAGIDRDGDGWLSPDEQRDYVRTVFAAIALELDGRSIGVRPGVSVFPRVNELLAGEGTIQLRSSIELTSVPDGVHQLAYRNRHNRDASVYLANALVPESDRVAVVAQRRDVEQRDLVIEYVQRPSFLFAQPWRLIAMLGAVMLTALLIYRITCRVEARIA